MSRYEVIENKAWQHTNGRLASVYGASPWTTLADAPNWAVISRGWTVRNPYTGEVGAMRPPFATREEAEAFADRVKPSRVSFGD